MNITLKKSITSDLEVFSQNQADKDAIIMAAFTAKDPYDKEGYLEKWTRLLSVDSVNMQTILVDEIVVGCVVKFVMGGDSDITYALAKKYWGKGIVSEAVRLFLEIEMHRPLLGRVVYDNYGSQKVLERNGFLKIGTNTDFANGRGKEVEEYLYKLEV